MYVTRPLSMYIRSPSALSLPPPEGPNSGILVILDEEAQPTCCFGSCNSDVLDQLPFPQNKKLIVCDGDDRDPVVLIPALNHPLSSNRYYAIQPHGKHKGKAFTNSKEEDVTTCCFGESVSDRKPEPFDPDNVYHQIEICRHNSGGFFAKSVAADGYPPDFLRRKGWQMTIDTPYDFQLSTEAPGLDTTLRAQLPDFNFPLSSKTSKSVIVGKWYCPFIFIKEDTLKNQLKRSMYYEMTLEQRWEQIFECENSHNQVNFVVVDVGVQTEVVSFGRIEAVPDERNVVDGMIWFKSYGDEGGEVSVGLSTLIIERMKWEQERFGWVNGGNERRVIVEKVEEFGGVGGWRKFGCYVLVEKFVLKRKDRSLVLTYDFKHTNQIRSNWE